MNLPFAPDLTGKTAVVTGGAGVLCAAFARALAACGANVAILDIAEDKAQAVADEIVQDGGNAIACKANVLDKASINRAHEQVLETYGNAIYC